MKVGDRAKTSLIGSKKKFQRHREEINSKEELDKMIAEKKILAVYFGE